VAEQSKHEEASYSSPVE